MVRDVINAWWSGIFPVKEAKKIKNHDVTSQVLNSQMLLKLYFRVQSLKNINLYGIVDAIKRLMIKIFIIIDLSKVKLRGSITSPLREKMSKQKNQLKP